MMRVAAAHLHNSPGFNVLPACTSISSASICNSLQPTRRLKISSQNRSYFPCNGVPFSSSSSGRSLQVECMAHPKRVQMVAKQIRREIANMLQNDKVLQHAVLPESALGADCFLSSVTTISQVEISRDLQYAKVYVSICGDDRGREIAMQGLKARAKYVRAQLGKRIRLRMTPHVHFVEDLSIEKSTRVLGILDSLRKERERKESQGVAEDSDTEDGVYKSEKSYLDSEEEAEETTSDDEWISVEDDLIYIR